MTSSVGIAVHRVCVCVCVCVRSCVLCVCVLYCHMTITCSLQARERGLLAQVSETTAEKHRLEDTICRLKSEGMASAASLKEALEQLEKEKETTVCVVSCDMSCDVDLCPSLAGCCEERAGSDGEGRSAD